MTCLVCHQANGNGLPPVFPPFNGSEFVTGDQRRFVAITLKGATAS
jgi:mono/diheme cytochrome c family protein